jgi:hypothetical protein
MASFPDAGIPNVLSARDFLIKQYGFLATTGPKESDYTVGATAVAIGSGKGQRLAYIVSNTGTVNVALAFNAAPTITTGILLQPGAAFISTWYYDLEVVGLPLWAIGASAGATLHMVENMIQGA